jgi:hypothetical protein
VCCGIAWRALHRPQQVQRAHCFRAGRLCCLHATVHHCSQSCSQSCTPLSHQPHQAPQVPPAGLACPRHPPPHTHPPARPVTPLPACPQHLPQPPSHRRTSAPAPPQGTLQSSLDKLVAAASELISEGKVDEAVGVLQQGVDIISPAFPDSPELGELHNQAALLQFFQVGAGRVLVGVAGAVLQGGCCPAGGR